MTRITCRAFQGIGASGLYSLTQIGLIEVGPVHRPSLIGAMVGATLAVAFVLGPLVGGVISQLSDWRWLFNMKYVSPHAGLLQAEADFSSIPCGLITILALTNFWPEENVAHLLSWSAFTRIDFLGSVSLLCSSGLLVFSIQQAGSQAFAWSSPVIISTLILSALCWIVFASWETFLEHRRFRNVEPIFPIRLMSRRVYVAGLL